MTNKILLSIAALLLAFQGYAQEQWASSIIKYSSQAGYKAYSAKQVVGEPNALQAGKNAVSWSPQGANAGVEYIEVGFATPMKVKQIAVWENFNPGAIYQIYLVESNGKEHKVFEQNKPVDVKDRARMFRHFIKLTPYKAASLKLVLNTAEVFGLNQIDAIGISSSDTPMRATINNPKDKSFVGKPENLGYEVNSQAPDLLPLISVDGQTLYFARKNHPENIGTMKKDDIYVSMKNSKKQWTPAYNIGPPLNDEYNNFVCAVNPDGTEVLISGKYDAGEGLYRTSYINGSWTKPKKIIIDGYVNKSPFVCYHVSPDMKYLVIAMEDNATYGDMDIYVSYLQPNGSYSKPKNLGPVINTAGQEPSVFLSADGKTIYFSSDGHPGYGAYDMFMSRRLDNSWSKWSKPVNLGNQINSDDWDLYYTVPADGMYAYYSSAKNSYGESDLYRIKLPKDVRPEPVAILKPNYVNLNTKTPIASLEKKKQPIIVSNDSKVELYQDVKGFFPVNDTEDLSDELEEEDNFETEAIADAGDPADDKMNDLLARLQELKNEQAQTETAIKQQTKPTQKQATAPKVYNDKYTSDLDDKLAELRSKMDKIEKGEVVEEVEEPVIKAYKVKAAEKPSAKETAKNAEWLEAQENVLKEMQNQQDALEDFESEGEYNTVTPRATQPRKTYELRTADTDYLDDHQSYRDELKELAEKKAKAAYGTQPLTKYSLAKTAIDEATSDELVESSMKKELEALKNKQKAVEHANPEVEAYRKKLEEIKGRSVKPSSVPTGGNRITKSEEQTKPKEENEEVLAYREKLEALKQKMNNLPSAEANKKTQPVATPKTPSTPEVPATEEVAVVTKPKSKASKRKGKQKEVEIIEPKLTPNVPTKSTVEESVADAEEAIVSETEEVVVEAIQPEAAEESAALDKALQAKQAEQAQLDKDVADLQNDKLAAEQAKAKAELDKQAVEAQKLAMEQEKLQLEKEKAAMEAQKLALQQTIADLQKERDEFLALQQKMESDKQKLEAQKLKQFKEVKQLEQEIKQLEAQKKKTAANVPTSTVAKQSSPKKTTFEQKEIFLVPLEEGVTVEIKNVFFNANSAYVKPDSYRELNKIVAFLEVNSNVKIEIGGHTNGLCQEDYCLRLSAKRANSVRDYLISNGITASRIEAKGYGKSVPIASNDSSDGRKKNQRVELKILSVSK